jgi:hypothetical protein
MITVIPLSNYLVGAAEQHRGTVSPRALAHSLRHEIDRWITLPHFSVEFADSAGEVGTQVLAWSFRQAGS